MARYLAEKARQTVAPPPAPEMAPAGAMPLAPRRPQFGRKVAR
jgi:hypothetical protein